MSILLVGRAGFMALAVSLAVSDAMAQSCVDESGLRYPPFLTSWMSRYPSSTLPNRIQTATGSSCNLCHHPPEFSNTGNCYREAIKALLKGGAGIDEAIDQLDGEDSDGDGFTNGEEITMPYPGGHVGYNPGLIGSTGTDPCSANLTEPVTGMAETPPAAPVVCEWGTVALLLSSIAVGSYVLRRKA